MCVVACKWNWKKYDNCFFATSSEEDRKMAINGIAKQLNMMIQIKSGSKKGLTA